jgi:hypothetical protein
MRPSAASANAESGMANRRALGRYVSRMSEEDTAGFVHTCIHGLRKRGWAVNMSPTA